MQKLRTAIEQYSRWSELSIYIDRIEAALISDFSLALENAKALLESIGKEICSAKGEVLSAAPAVHEVLKRAFYSLGYSNTSLVNQVSRSLANIGREIGGLRNDISATSHGRSLEELRERNSKVDTLTREFLIDSTMVVAVFLIRTFEERKDVAKLALAEAEEHIDYSNATAFNAYWDENYGDFKMGEYSFDASEILYGLDYKAYKNEHDDFVEGGQEQADPEVGL